MNLTPQKMEITTLEKALKIYEEIEFLENPVRFGRNVPDIETINNMEKIYLMSGNYQLAFDKSSDEFENLKFIFRKDRANRIIKIEDLKRQLAEL